MFFVTVLPAYIVTNASIVRQTMLLSAGYVAIATIVHLVIVALAAQAHGWMTVGNRRNQVRRIFAVLLAMVAIWFLVSTR